MTAGGRRSEGAAHHLLLAHPQPAGAGHARAEAHQLQVSAPLSAFSAASSSSAPTGPARAAAPQLQAGLSDKSLRTCAPPNGPAAMTKTAALTLLREPSTFRVDRNLLQQPLACCTTACCCLRVWGLHIGGPLRVVVFNPCSPLCKRPAEPATLPLTRQQHPTYRMPDGGALAMWQSSCCHASSRLQVSFSESRQRQRMHPEVDSPCVCPADWRPPLGAKRRRRRRGTQVSHAWVHVRTQVRRTLEPSADAQQSTDPPPPAHNRPRVSILGSRQQQCVHPAVSKLSGEACNQACRALTAKRTCGWCPLPPPVALVPGPARPSPAQPWPTTLSSFSGLKSFSWGP